MNWTAKIIKHRDEQRIAIFFEKDAATNAIIKQINGARWSQQLKAWHIPDTAENRQNFELPLASDKMLSKEGEQAIEDFRRWLRSKRYSENTQKTYTEALKSFLVFYKAKNISALTNEDVVFYNNEYIIKNKLSASFQNQIVNAIKLYFKTIQDKSITLDKIHRPKRGHLLPNVLSKQEVKLILEAHHNIKHKMMLSLIYSCGLRCGELLALKPVHIDSKRNIVLLKNAKGNKDRMVPLSRKILDMLRAYYKVCKPVVYLFEGQTAGMPYEARSLQQVLKQALVKVKNNEASYIALASAQLCYSFVREWYRFEVYSRVVRSQQQPNN